LTAPPRRPPVILLPGAFGQELVYWNVWQYFLERDGFHVYPASFPRFTFSDHRASARLLAEKVEEVLAVEEAPRAALVAHSFGGLIARYYLKFLRGHERIDHLSCLATPHHGTWTAVTAPLLTAARQTVPGAPFLAELNDPKVTHGGVPILNIWSRWDGIVVPARSAVLEEPGVENRELRFVGHWGLLVSRRAYSWIREALQRVEPAPAAP
jgi:triacylglycerol esterase/lipase EstA (alpha/beta hydrolase family)